MTAGDGTAKPTCSRKNVHSAMPPAAGARASAGICRAAHRAWPQLTERLLICFDPTVNQSTVRLRLHDGNGRSAGGRGVDDPPWGSTRPGIITVTDQARGRLVRMVWPLARFIDRV
jgi:hypothetical protein